MNGYPQRTGHARRTLRRTAFPALLCTALCLLIARPAGATPATPGSGIPNAGSPPVASTPIQVPGAATPVTTTPVAGPLGTQIMNEAAAVEALGEQVISLGEQVSAAHQATQATFTAWQAAQDAKTALKSRADNAAADAYQQADALGPLSGYVGDLRGLGAIAPGFGGQVPVGPPDTAGLAAAAAHAAEQETLTFQAYQSALLAEQDLTNRRDSVQAGFSQRSTALSDLKSRNQSAVTAAEAAQQAKDSTLAGQFGAGTNVKGMTAGPQAKAAIAYALKQLGKPYVWGAEGPNSYDCSGLTWAAYRSTGVSIPRVAADQQHAIKAVPVSELLPGDLVFFSTASSLDWHTVSHVGMYLGDGKMVEAPTTGDVVKIATVWWSAFFSAGRVVPAVPGPAPSPTATPSATPSPTPSSSPSASPSPSDSPTPTDSPTPAPLPSDSPSVAPNASNSPSPAVASSAPSASSTPSDTPTPNPTPSPAAAPSPTPSVPPTSAAAVASSAAPTSPAPTGTP